MRTITRCVDNILEAQFFQLFQLLFQSYHYINCDTLIRVYKVVYFINCTSS